MPKKLSLSTETLRVLADEDLVAVKGGKTGANGKCNKRNKTGRGACKRKKP
jgi:hypothetical protein